MLVNAHEASAGGPLDGSASPHIASKSFPQAGDRTRCYLLFAGLYQAPHGGLGDLVGTFTSEKTAREAFQEIRLNCTSHTSWAQLAVVDAHGIKPLCWFGIGAKPAGKSLTFPHARKVTARQTEGGAMQVETPESSAREPATTAGPKFRRISRRRVSKKITPALMGVLALGVTAIALLVNNSGSEVPLDPNPARVSIAPDAVPVVPFPVHPPAVLDGARSFDG